MEFIPAFIAKYRLICAYDSFEFAITISLASNRFAAYIDSPSIC